jgi:hypothetical protein
VATTLTISILADVAKAVQGIDNVDKRTQSWGSNMKNLAVGIGSAFSVDKIKGWAESWINSGLDASRALRNVKVVFGDAAKGVDAWGEKAATTFGTTAAEAEKMAAKVGVALTGYGMDQATAAKASEDLVQRTAEMSKVLGVDQLSVLQKVETAMRGRTAGLKDYGVAVDKGASSTEVFNAFMDQTSQYAGQADTPIASLKATFGDLSAQLGQALLPIIAAVIPLLQTVGQWAKDHKGPFDAIVIVITALALAFGIATTAASVFAVAQLGALWPILAVVAAVAAMVAIVILVIKYWSDLVGWYHTAADAVVGFIDRFQILLLLFGGPLGIALVALRHFSDIWGAIKTAVDAVASAISKVWDWAEKVGGSIGKWIGKIPGVGGNMAAPAGAPGVAAYGVGATAAPVTFAPSITITGDVGDPILAGRRIVAALETWTAANGRRRLTALVGGP